ncbi:Protein T08B1.1 [Aphelenchoides avenae]|nr:Protein T08B1.1 [Aphelenchus avenae]
MSIVDKSELLCKSPAPRLFDELFDKIRHYGRYQIFMLFVIQYTMLNAAGNYVFISFAGLKPECAIPEVERISDACEKLDQCPLNFTRRVFHSLYDEPDFVCPNSQLPHHLQTIQAVGSGFGAIIAGHLADALGRKWIIYVGALQMTGFGLVGAFAPSWWWLALAMLGMGLAYGTLDVLMTLASESAGPRYRIVQTLAFQWSIAMQIAALLAYLSGSWRNYLMTLNLVCAPLLVLMLFFRESPRWLIQKRWHDRAVRELNAISKWNRSPARFVVSDLANIELCTEKESKKTYSLWHLVSTKKLIAYSIVMVLSALTVEMCVAVIIFDVQVLAGDPFFNVALYGILRLWVPFFVVFMEFKASWFGRKMLFMTSQAFSVVCYGAVLVMGVLLTEDALPSAKVIRTVLALAGGIVNSSIFFTIYKQYSIELYPTLMRGKYQPVKTRVQGP